VRHCPAEIFPEYRRETDTVRGILYESLGPQVSPEKKEKPLPPCQEACPIGQDVRGYIRLIAQGRFQEAFDVILRTNPLPAICGFICHHPCEEACLRAHLDDPVAIRMLKGFVAMHGGAKKAFSPKRDRKHRVALIGAGPAGLAAARDLAWLGYTVTIFEKLPVAGGMLWVGIPAFRLPREILKMEIDAILALGVELKTGLTLGRDFSIHDLREEGFEATFIATGAHRSGRLHIEGEDLKRIFGGVEFLRSVNLGEEVSIGSRVAIIGGGNVAIDSARAAFRLGDREVDLYYRRSQREMPALGEEVEEARREGIRMHWLTTPKAFVGDHGTVRALVCLKNRLSGKDSSGRRMPLPIEGSEYLVKADTVIVAVGQETGGKDLGVGIELSGNGTIPVDGQTAATSIPGVFAGGDVVSGPGWAIDAIAWGKKAARGIDAYLSGR
jgi:NADH-quinone oxidoreductase subunit F